MTTNRRAALVAVTTAVGLIVAVLALAGSMLVPSNASTVVWLPSRVVTATKTVHVTRTVTASATVTATATATATVTVPGPTRTVTATVPGPTTTATATATPTSAGSHLPLFGAFPGFDSTTDTSSYATRLAKVTTEFGGKLGVERRFMGTNFTLPTMTNAAILSWDFPPAATLAGQYDAQIDAIAKGATKPLWFVPWHEVENGPKLSAADYVAVFRYLANRVHADGNPLVHMTTIFMGYSVRGGNLAVFNSYYPGDAYVDDIGFDQYINPGIPYFTTPEGSFQQPIAIAAAHHKPLVIGEVSLYPGYSDAQWTDYVARTIKLLDTPDTDAVSWFETNKSDGDWRMASHTSAVPEWSRLTTR